MDEMNDDAILVAVLNEYGMFTCVIGLFLNLVNRVDCAQFDRLVG